MNSEHDDEGKFGKRGLAMKKKTYLLLVTMLVLVFCVDQLFWRPLTVWGQKFKSDFSTAAVQPD